MIETMEFIALIVGVLFGYWIFGKRDTLNWLFIAFYTSAYSSKKSFYALYDIADDEISYEWYRNHNGQVKKYADYLKLHAEARSSAFETFRSAYDAMKKMFIYRTLPIILAPAIIFWSLWHMYLLGVLVTVAYFIAHELIKYGYRPGFYQRIMVYTSMNFYYRNKNKL